MAKHHHKHHDGHHHAEGGPIEAPGHEHGMHYKHGGHAGHKGHHHGKKHRASGGRTHEFVSGNPDVMKEAHDEHGTEKKHGGAAKHHKGKHHHHHGKHHKATGGGVALGLMTGGGVRPRLDKPGRKKGGRVGADHSPLSSAHHGHGGGEGSSNPHDTYGGTPP